jgi:hypothetical protein
MANRVPLKLHPMVITAEADDSSVCPAHPPFWVTLLSIKSWLIACQRCLLATSHQQVLDVFLLQIFPRKLNHPSIKKATFRLLKCDNNKEIFK